MIHYSIYLAVSFIFTISTTICFAKEIIDSAITSVTKCPYIINYNQINYIKNVCFAFSLWVTFMDCKTYVHLMFSVTKKLNKIWKEAVSTWHQCVLSIVVIYLWIFIFLLNASRTILRHWIYLFVPDIFFFVHSEKLHL